MHRSHCVIQFKIQFQITGLNHAQHYCCCSHFQIVDFLRHVCVTNNDVKASVHVRICMWFITGIDDWPTQRGFQTHFSFKKICTLAYLKSGLNVFLSQADSSSSSEYTSGDKEWRQKLNKISKRNFSNYLIVFVCSVTNSFTVSVVFVNGNQITS